MNYILLLITSVLMHCLAYLMPYVLSSNFKQVMKSVTPPAGFVLGSLYLPIILLYVIVIVDIGSNVDLNWFFKSNIKLIYTTVLVLLVPVVMNIATMITVSLLAVLDDNRVCFSESNSRTIAGTYWCWSVLVILDCSVFIVTLIQYALT